MVFPFGCCRHGSTRALLAAWAACQLGLAGAPAQAADFVYTGPVFPAYAATQDHIEIRFSTAAPLAAHTSYLSLAEAGATQASVRVVSGGLPMVNMSLPVATFQLHTDGNGRIDAWFILGDYSGVTGQSPTMTGPHRQAYSMNTMVFIPGSDRPGAPGTVTGHYNYDQATDTQFVTTCAGAPPDCSHTAEGQPYYGVYSALINPSNTGQGNWSGSVVSPALDLVGSWHDGVVGQAYAATFSASGGVAPYGWSTSGLPAGLSQANGRISGTPTAAGTTTATVTVTDAAAAQASVSGDVHIWPADCSGSNAIVSSVLADYLVVNGGRSLGDQVWYTPPGGTTFTGGLTAFAPGEYLDYRGQMSATDGCHAATIVVRPAPLYTCKPPPGAMKARGRGVVTSTGDHHFTTAQGRVSYGDCTRMESTSGRPLEVGAKVEWRGYQTSDGYVFARRIEIK